MSLVSSTRTAHAPAARALREAADPKKPETAPWRRTGPTDPGARQTAASPDKLPPWVGAAAQQVAGFAQNHMQGPYNLGVHIGMHIREYIDGRGNLREDVAALLRHPGVMAAAATVAPRIIGALAANQLAFGAPPQIGQHPPA